MKEEEERVEVPEAEVQGQNQLEVTEEEVADQVMIEVETREKESIGRTTGLKHQGKPPA